MLNQYIIKFCKISKMIFKQFKMRTNLDELQTEQYIPQQFQSIAFQKDQNIPTSPHSFDCVPRSTKNKQIQYATETSFQPSFIESHETAFIIFKEDYINLVKTHGYQDEEVEEQYEKNKENQSLSLIELNSNFSYEEKRLFQTDLSYQENFNNFLCKICKTVNRSLAKDLVYVADLFWQKYVPRQGQQLSESDIKKFVETILQQQQIKSEISKLEAITFRNSGINSDQYQSQVIPKLKQFLRKFGITLILIFQEYFTNPFSKGYQESQSSEKRQKSFREISNDELSDEQDEEQCYGSKKRKF